MLIGELPAPIAVFGWRRPDHLARTLEALSACPEARSASVFIFLDGPKDDTQEHECFLTRQVARSDWLFARTKVVERTTNLGLSNSILTGVDKVLSEHEMVVVVEDDVLVSPVFLTYMNKALQAFRSEERVASIHGYVYPLDEPILEPFFLRGADCWGWATWKRAWTTFERDPNVLIQLLEDRGLLQAFDYDGKAGFRRMLQQTASGEIDSWAVRWHASCFVRDLLTLYPGQSLVENIGLDGSGVHCPAGDSSIASGSFQWREPPAVEESNEAREQFKRYFARYLGFWSRLGQLARRTGHRVFGSRGVA